MQNEFRLLTLRTYSWTLSIEGTHMRTMKATEARVDLDKKLESAKKDGREGEMYKLTARVSCQRRMLFLVGLP